MTDKLTSDPKKGLTYPCRFPIKVLGESGADFQDRVVKAIQSVLPGDYTVSVNQSKHKNFQSVSVNLFLHEEAELHRITAALKAVPGVRVVL